MDRFIYEDGRVVLREAFQNLLQKYTRVTLLAHKNADGDTLGTALGLYSLCKNIGKQVEVCCIDKKLPKNLDFLPHFARIKRQIDFDDSLIIACGASEVGLFGFDLSSREIMNIDHHKSNTDFGTLNIVDQTSASTSQVAYKLIQDGFEVTQSLALCLYVGLLTETENFKTLNVDQDVFLVAAELLAYGIDLEEIHRNIYQRDALSSLRLLSATLDTLELYEEAEVASFVVTQEMFQQSGSNTTELAGIVDYGIDLATVKIAILVVEDQEAIKVFLRSKREDVSSLAKVFGGTGEKLAAEFSSEKIEIKKLLNKILNEINKKGLLDA